MNPKSAEVLKATAKCKNSKIDPLEGWDCRVELPLDGYGEAEEEEKDEEEDEIEADNLFFGSGEAEREEDMEIEDGECKWLIQLNT